MKVLKIILNIVLSFILVCLILAMVALNIVNNNILNKDYLLSKMEETEFYLQVYREVESGFEDFIYQSGLPEETIKDLASEDTIKKDLNKIVDSIYNQTEYELSSSAVRNELDNRIKNYVESQKKTLNRTERENIEKFEDLIVNSYETNIQISADAIKTLQNGYVKADSILEKYSMIPIVAIVIVVILIVIVNIKQIKYILKYFGISVASAGIMLKLLKTVVMKSIDIDRVKVLATSITTLIQNIYRDIIYKIDNIGLYMIIAGFTAIIVFSIFKAFEKSEASRKE